MALPKIKAYAAFASDALDVTPTWTEITDYVLGFTSTRGRSSVRDRYNPGTFSLHLDNFDGRFDAHNTAGAYYSSHALGGIRPSVQIKVDTVNDVRLFTGWAESWKQNYAAPSGATTSVVGFDLAALIGGTNVQSIAASPRAAETALARFDDLCGTRLNLASGWYQDRYDPQRVIAETTYGASARSVMNEIEDVEAGYIWVTKEGVLTFDGRYAFFRDPGRLTSGVDYLLEDNPSATPGAGQKIVRYANPQVDTNLDLLFTEVTGSGASGYEKTIRNTTRWAQLGPLSHTLATKCEFDRQVDDNTQFAVSQFALLSPRVEEVTVDALDDADDSFDCVEQTELLDTIWLGHTPPGGGDRFSGYHTIEKISHVATGTSWRTTFGLGNAHRFSFAGYGNWYQAGDNKHPGSDIRPSM